jgi:predicted small metal-binding protein
MVRSHDEAEVSSIVIAHAKAHHNKDLTHKDVKAMMMSDGKKDKKKEGEKK